MLAKAIRDTRSYGASLLAQRPESASKIAKRLGLSHTAIDKWLAGTQSPRLEVRVELSRLFKIPIEAWDQRTPSEADAKPKAMGPSPNGEIVRSRGEELERMVQSLLDAAREPNLTPIIKARLVASCTSTLTLLARITGASDVDERRIRQSPAWQRIEAAILVALEPWPDAMRATAEAIAKLG